MGNHHTALATVMQTLPSWMGFALGHLAENATLSNAALIASIAYSVVNVYYILRRKHVAARD